MKHLWIVAVAGFVVAGAGLAETPAGPASRPSSTQTAAQALSDEAQVRASLKMIVNDVQMQHLELLEAFDRVRELCNQNIYIDIKSLRMEGVTTGAKVTYKTDKATVAEVLTEILKQGAGDAKSSLSFDVMGKTIVISSKGRLRDLIVQYHTDIYKLGNPTVAEILNKPINDLKMEHIPFRNAIAMLGKQAGQVIKIDKDSVIAAGVSLETPITVQVKALNLAQTLRLVLHDAEGNSPLDYIVEDGKISVFGPAPQ